MKLYKHQIETINNAANKWGLFFRMRVGKTPTAIKLADTRVKTAIVICPKSILNQWEREIKTWSDGSCKFLVYSREQFRLKHKEIPKCDAIIGDEVHVGFANYKSQLFKSVVAYIRKHNINHIWLLTGTAYTSTPWSVYSYSILLGKDWKWFDFRQAFFDTFRLGKKPLVGPDRRRVITKPKEGPFIEARLQELLKKMGTVIDLKDIKEIVPDEDSIEYFSLNKEQKKLIEIGYDINHMTRYTKQHQAESGVLLGDGYREDMEVTCAKDKRLLEIVEASDKTIVVFRYLKQMEKYENLFKSLGIPIFKISGQEKESASDVADKAEKEERAIILAQGDTAAGYSLKSFSLMVFASMSYSFVNYDQMRFRIQAKDKTTPNYYIHLLTDGDSIDQAIYNSVIKKQDFSFNLYAKQRENKA